LSESLTENNTKEGDLSYAYTVLVILFLAFASNQWSRQAIYYLCDFSDNADPFLHINADIIFSKYPGHFVTCKCGCLSVDQTEDYIRILGNQEDYTEVINVEAC
jgi:hypothetical protein